MLISGKKCKFFFGLFSFYYFLGDVVVGYATAVLRFPVRAKCLYGLQTCFRV